MHGWFKTTQRHRSYLAGGHPATHLPTRTAARQVVPSGDALLPDLSTTRYEVRLTFPASGTDEDEGEERDDHHQLLGEQPSSSSPSWKYPALLIRPRREEESPKYMSADSPWASPGRSVRKETLLPVCPQPQPRRVEARQPLAAQPAPPAPAVLPSRAVPENVAAVPAASLDRSSPAGGFR